MTGICVTQDQIDLSADATADHQWIHVDASRAAAGPFGSTIAHGVLTLSLLPALCAQIYRVDRVQMGVNYGCNKVRFVFPVPVDSLVRAVVHIVAVDPYKLGYLVTRRPASPSRSMPAERQDRTGEDGGPDEGRYDE